MAYPGLRKGRGVRTRSGSGYRGGFRGGLSRSDMNMIVLLRDQDGGGTSDELIDCLLFNGASAHKGFIAPARVMKVIPRTVRCYIVVMNFRK